MDEEKQEQTSAPEETQTPPEGGESAEAAGGESATPPEGGAEAGQ